MANGPLASGLKVPPDSGVGTSAVAAPVSVEIEEGQALRQVALGLQQSCSDRVNYLV